ncbi:MAG TPA: GNAT family protein [Noviherbaspirillum sp.]|uniref:GNAT family N-acetyltransferase n=1 Tax=Noviherbaspirillum sp. TaxID=1926288 RepID=UPI002DDD9D4C|nr:GNAT family protein [Noviherbaspirillum sp.]HEV2612472.1 GNAT family protein [Noviherbaspirillum sp.]
MGFAQPAILAGRHVKLEPLALQHLDGLKDAVRDGELWKLWYTVIASPDDMEKEVVRRLGLQEQGIMLPFTVRRQDTGAICGMTTYMNIDAVHRRVEIGSTWYARSVQRTALNTEAKLLLLTHAFDELRCIAVEFRTHWMNHASRNAITRLGAKQDGVLRNHQRMADGSYRDTVVFSIIDAEWPTVRRHLQYKLEDVSC